MTIEAVPGGVRIRFHVQPGASRTEVAGLHGDRIKLRIQAPPVDGRANEAIVSWLAGRLGVPVRDVSLTAGASSRQKTVEVRGVVVAQVEERLRP